jgi:hypothetical protein
LGGHGWLGRVGRGEKSVGRLPWPARGRDCEGAGEAVKSILRGERGGRRAPYSKKTAAKNACKA